MSTVGIAKQAHILGEKKPRWSEWEGKCLKDAFEQKIPLKIIALVLQKSLTSVSKKISTLGLRTFTSRCGRIKGQPYQGPLKGQRAVQDIYKMFNLLKKYAPASLFQKKGLSENIRGGPPCLARLFKQSCLYSWATAMPYKVLEEKEDVFLPGVECGCDRSFYVPFVYVEKWALLKGFQKVNPHLGGNESYYWRQGQYFSPTQLFIQLNGIRLARKLSPLHLSEEETKH